MLLTKVCIKCPWNGTQPLDHFYKRGDRDKVSNVCKECTKAAVMQRHWEQKANTFINKHRVVVLELTGVLKICYDCDIEKDEAHFRPYVTKVNGKEYPYRANKCRECEAGNEKGKRWAKTLFNEAEYTDITDSYNTDRITPFK